MWIEQHIVERGEPGQPATSIQDIRTPVEPHRIGGELASLYGALTSALWQTARQLQADGWTLDWRHCADSFVAERGREIQWVRIGHGWSN